jgi:mono/diheme cytochrome c family protein
MTQAQMRTRLYSGATNMPSYTNILSPDEVSAIVAFLASRTKFPSAPPTP